jgi:hypothetical protein
VVARAGGLTDRAYLYGAYFSRKSTRALEQAQLNDYADRVAHQMERNSLSLVSASSGSGQQGVSIAAQQVAATNRQLIDRIRGIRATGRIVLKMSPHSAGLNAIPDMNLEDGDQFTVSFTPETIQVVGAVFNQNAFIYSDRARIDEYLRLAGGPSREADRKRIFVLRADGSVIPYQSGDGVFESDFYKKRLYPGDAVIVPEKDVHPSLMNQLMIWGQLMSGLSLNAAEIQLLK